MRNKLNRIFVLVLTTIYFCSYSQSGINVAPDKEKKFAPFMYYRHGGAEGLEEFKKEHRYDYLKELWYYTSSFYIRRDYYDSGVELDESIIDISRFESYRKENEEAVVKIDGYKDALILLPLNQLIYKPK